MKNPGSKFLHDRNPNLHTSLEVEGVVDYLRANGEKIPNEPAQKIEGYLGFLANKDYVNDGILTGDKESIDRQIEAHVIKSEDVPEGYFELQRRIAREQGHGDITITDTLREQLVEAAQSDQRSSLGQWVEYLGGDDGSYPDWFRYYAWSSVTRLGNYDKEKGEFLKRSKGTTAPYPELNREALAYVFDGVHKKAKGEAVDESNDEQLQKLLQAANFGKLYSHAVLKMQPATPEQKKNVEGSWTKYEQSDDPRTARRLADSLQGHGTGWCTAGESTAETQLKNGDFYVYYTRDGDGKDTVPRVAVRMQAGKVVEVRGIDHQQELEPIMTDIVLEKVKDLPGGEEYTQKAEDMKLLTALERKLIENPDAELTTGEVTFLYELEKPIQSFGYRKDPRVGKLVSERGILRDMVTLFGSDPEDNRATILATIIEAERGGEYSAIDKVFEQYTGLSSEFAQMLINSGRSDVVSRNLSSFTSLSDEMAQQFITSIRGIDIASFNKLSEDTFFKLVDEFRKLDRRNDRGSQTYLWRLLERAAAGNFDLPDRQRVINELMNKGLWGEVTGSLNYFDDLDTGAIASRMISEGKIAYIAANLQNFPTVDHEELANQLLKEVPSSLATNLRNFNVDKNVYARKLIEVGAIYDLHTFSRNIEGYDQDVLDSFEAHKVAQAKRAEERRIREEELKAERAEWDRQEKERIANWDDDWGDPYA